MGVAYFRSTSLPRKSAVFCPWAMPREVGILPFDEDARMQQHLHEESGLPLGEPEGGQALGALTVGLLNAPGLGGWCEAHSHSSTPRGTPPRLAPPPLPPTRPPMPRYRVKPDRAAAAAWAPR